ncbi:MAG TPA: hypothetical protein VGQ90_17255, partial [Stellaceae bacterium]|nr:hypothetical protein [Stellaceae bacterium]
MEPTADGLVEVTPDLHPIGAAMDEVVASAANGHDAAVDGGDVDLQQLLYALQAARAGNFSVRLPGDRIGLAGKIADTFN